MQNSPSCQCCAIVCGISDTDDASTECIVGTGTGTSAWSGTATRTPSGDNTLLVYDETVLAGAAWLTKVSVALDPQASGSPNAIVRLIGGATDCNDYVFLQYTPWLVTGPTASPPNTAISLLELGKSVGGVETILATFRFESLSYSSPGGSNRSIDLRLCWDGTTLTGWSGTNPATSNGFLASRDVAIPDSRAGFGVTTYVQMDSVVFSSYFLERANVGACFVCPQHCCQGPVCRDITVTISGVDSRSLVVGGCNTNCININGTYVLPAVSAINVVSGSGDSLCRWRLTVFLSAQCPLTLTVTTTSNSGGVISIVFAATMSVVDLLFGVGTTTDPCSDWSSDIPLSVTTGAGGGSCAPTGAETGTSSAITSVKVRKT